MNGKDFNYGSDPKLHVEEMSPELARKAALVAVAAAEDAADARLMLAMLGLDEAQA